MKRYDYLVAYNFSKEGYLTPGIGTMQISRIKKIKTLEDIDELNKYIENQVEGIKNVSIYNFILLGRNKHER